MNEKPVALTLSVFIPRPYAEVYDFMSQPENLPQWAGGLGQEVQKLDDGWLVQTAAGPMRMTFAGRNDFGVLDHTVYPPGVAAVYVPMRVLAHGSGSEVMLTLFRQPEMSDEDYARDAETVGQDLQRLQQLLTP